MKRHALSSRIIPAVVVLVFALAASGCTNPLSGPAPSVTVTAPYVPPSPTPIPVITATPTPVPTQASWNGEIVKLFGNVTVKGGEHVYGTIKVNYMDKNYWEEYPTARYDTDDGGEYSIDVMANVPFKVTLGYTYVDRLSMGMTTRLLDDIYLLRNDTRQDFTIMSANATQVK